MKTILWERHPETKRFRIVRCPECNQPIVFKSFAHARRVARGWGWKGWKITRVRGT